MLYEVTGNILDESFGFKFICHQVNCKGVMGSGLAKQIREKYPFVYQDYKEVCDSMHNPLGNIVVSRKSGVNTIAIINMFAQDNYGTDKQYTDYKAFQECLDRIERYIGNYSKDWTIAFPYRIGCGLAGGDWDAIKEMLVKFSDKVKQDVYIVRYLKYKGR